MKKYRRIYRNTT